MSLSIDMMTFMWTRDAEKHVFASWIYPITTLLNSVTGTRHPTWSPLS